MLKAVKIQNNFKHHQEKKPKEKLMRQKKAQDAKDIKRIVQKVYKNNKCKGDNPKEKESKNKKKIMVL